MPFASVTTPRSPVPISAGARSVGIGLPSLFGLLTGLIGLPSGPTFPMTLPLASKVGMFESLGVPSANSDEQADAATAARTALAPSRRAPAPKLRRRGRWLDDARGALLTPVIQLPVG